MYSVPEDRRLQRSARSRTIIPLVPSMSDLAFLSLKQNSHGHRVSTVGYDHRLTYPIYIDHITTCFQLGGWVSLLI